MCGEVRFLSGGKRQEVRKQPQDRRANNYRYLPPAALISEG